MFDRLKLVLLALIAAASLTATSLNGQSLAIRNTTLIDGTGDEPRSNVTVIVEDGRFSTISPLIIDIPENIRTIDGAGKYLIPGLMDVHVHVPGNALLSLDGDILRPENKGLGISTLHSFLYSGITTIYDAGSNADYILALRADERSDKLLSPRIFASGSSVTFPGSWGAGINSTLIDRWPDGKVALDRNFARNPDLQKITYENFGAGANAWVPSFPDDVITSIIQYAKLKGVRTTIHISDEAHARIALAAGVDTFAHPVAVGKISNSFIPLIAKSGVVVASTLAVFDNIVKIVEAPDFLDSELFRAVYTTAQIEDMKSNMGARFASLGWDSWFKTTLSYSMENVKLLHDAGVTIALGTDRAIGPLSHRELELYTEAGISPLDAITMGTLNAAKYLGKEAELGTIERGKIADMVLLKKNPLDDIRNTQHIAAVFKGGVEIDRDTLQIPRNRNSN